MLHLFGYILDQHFYFLSVSLVTFMQAKGFTVSVLSLWESIGTQFAPCAKRLGGLCVLDITIFMCTADDPSLGVNVHFVMGFTNYCATLRLYFFFGLYCSPLAQIFRHP
jgi:hypothetical protein